MISDERIAEWQKERDQGRVSALGEYTPSEFWELLEAYVTLKAEVTERIEADEREELVEGTPERQLFDLAHAWGDNKIHNYQLMHRIETIVEKLRTACPPAQAAQVDRARETPRRQQAVEMLLELGWTYNSERGWEEPATTAEPVAQGGVPLPFSPYMVFEWKSPTERHSWTAYTEQQMRDFAAAHVATYPHSPDAAETTNPPDADTLSKPPRLGGCCCGEPCTLGVVHRTDGPCFVYEQPADSGRVVDVSKLLRDVRSIYIGATRPTGDGCDAETWDRIESALAAQPQSAASPAGVPDGWQLAPIKSTDAMHQAYTRAKYDGPKPTLISDLWDAMLAAVPSATREGG